MKLLYGAIVLLLFACSKSTNNSSTLFQLNKPSIIVIQMDSLEIESLKTKLGEDDFYTAADDLMWYNSMLIERCDSLKTPMLISDSDSVVIEYNEKTFLLAKDSTYGIYTYFLFDGKNVERKELLELIGL